MKLMSYGPFSSPILSFLSPVPVFRKIRSAVLGAFGSFSHALLKISDFSQFWNLKHHFPPGSVSHRRNSWIFLFFFSRSRASPLLALEHACRQTRVRGGARGGGVVSCFCVATRSSLLFAVFRSLPHRTALSARPASARQTALSLTSFCNTQLGECRAAEMLPSR